MTRVYTEVTVRSMVLAEIRCNVSGRVWIPDGQQYLDPEGNRVPEPDMVHLKMEYGYFSQHDGEAHSADICEDCMFGPLRPAGLVTDMELY